MGTCMDTETQYQTAATQDGSGQNFEQFCIEWKSVSNITPGFGHKHITIY
jgi:hypothetical protein